MSYKVVIDSCGELLDEWKQDPRFESVALTLSVDGVNIIDDETFDQADFLKRVAECPECPKSACPSPERYMRAFDCEAEHVYAVTLSAALHSSRDRFQTAFLLFLYEFQFLLQEDHPDRQIHIFNSKSASVGQTLIAMKIQECEEAGLPFEKVIETVEEYIEQQHTFFVLDNLETLRKNGRLSKEKALVASALKIKPVMGATEEGAICQLDQARGMNKALVKMAQIIVEKTADSGQKTLAISHCNCHERAILLKNALEERMPIKKIVILDTAGVSSMYANDGGVIVAV